MAGSSYLDHFYALSDPRQSWKVVYPLPEILLIVLCGTMACMTLPLGLDTNGRRG